MQIATVSAFRARLRRLGYTEISIKHVNKPYGEWLVSARDPFFGHLESRYCSYLDLHFWR